MVDPLVTLDEAKRRLNVYHEDQDDDINDAIMQATAVVLDYIKKPDATTLTAPQLLCAQVGCLQMLRFIWNGEDSDGVKYVPADGYLPQAVTTVLHRLRDPALA
jgi:hypothetical protein